MDFNDIKSRLSRTLTSLDGRFNEVFVSVSEIKDDDNFRIRYNIGNESGDSLLNKILIILYNLASLKDNLKNSLKNKGANSNSVEELINDSLHLQVLIDLVNQDKHGYPLTRQKRSNRNPLIVDVKQMIQIPEGVSMSFHFDGVRFENGEGKMIIDAMIVDDNQIRIFDLDELVETSYQKLEKFAIQNNCC